LFIYDDYDRSKEFFLEAIGVEADCVEAIYNLGLVYKKLNYYNEAL
jgi:intraflagellar transport protein 88